jgi:hypothetical protein
MTGPHLLILAVIVVFVVAFVITVCVLNASARKIIATNTKMVEYHNTLLEQNARQGNELEKHISELEEQKERIENLQRQQEEPVCCRHCPRVVLIVCQNRHILLLFAHDAALGMYDIGLSFKFSLARQQTVL